MQPQKAETIIVTGSSGLIGAPVCERLAADYNVVAFDRPGAPHPPPSADRMDVDLTNEGSVEEAFRAIRQRYGNNIASVIHLAAYYDFAGKPSPLYEEITVKGTERLLRHLKPFHVEQFIFSSTLLVHAPSQPGVKINEESPLAPKWDYPKSKVKTENLIRRERGKTPVLILRIAGVYDDQCHSIPIAHQIQRIYERSPTSHLFPGDITHGQSFIHLDDTVHLLLQCVANRRKLSQEVVLLAGEPKTLSYDTLQKEFGRLIHGIPWKTRHISRAAAKFGAWLQDHIPLAPDPFIKPWMIDLADDHYEIDISRARKLVGWEPKHSLAATLEPMILHLKSDPAAWYKENKLRPPFHFPPLHNGAASTREKELVGK